MSVNLSLPYKVRLMELAGLDVADLLTESDPYVRKNERIPFSKELMQQAIEYGLEVGILFQSKNEKYKMPISKFRLIMPVAMGIDPKGRMMLRGVHITGQSEKVALQTGQRSAEAKNVWRLFNTANIKSMFFTGKTYTKVPIGGYKPNDSAFVKTLVAFNGATAKKRQDDYNRSHADNTPDAVQQKRQGMIKSFFRNDVRQAPTPLAPSKPEPKTAAPAKPQKPGAVAPQKDSEKSLTPTPMIKAVA